MQQRSWSVFAALALTASAFGQTATMAPQTGVFNGPTRGYYFTAPVDFTITGVQVLLQDGSGNLFQNFAIVRFDANTPPMVYPLTTNSFSQLALGLDLPQNVFQPVNIPIFAGEVIGVYGNTTASTGTTSGANSYAGNVQQTTTIAGNSVNLFRSGMQFHLGSATSPLGMHDVWHENNFNITRVEFTYTTAPAGPIAYCTAGTSTNGCSPSIGADHLPSVSQSSPCNISVSGVEGLKSGLIFYGVDNTGFAPLQWGATGTSFLCVKAPTQRSLAQSSGGTSGLCNGTLSLDWNAFQLANPGALGHPWSVGSKVYVQGWYRDPPAVKTTNLSDALELTYVP